MDQTIVILFIAAAVALIVYAVMNVFVDRGDSTKLRERMKDRAPDGQPAAKQANTKQAVGNVLSRIGTVASQPFMPKKREQTRLIDTIGRQVASHNMMGQLP